MDSKALPPVQLIVNDLNDIAAEAYRHRIRPPQKRGGGGAYDRTKGGSAFSLTPRLSENRRASFQIVSLNADTISLKAVVQSYQCAVLATVNERGQLTKILLQVSGEVKKI